MHSLCHGAAGLCGVYNREAAVYFRPRQIKSCDNEQDVFCLLLSNSPYSFFYQSITLKKQFSFLIQSKVWTHSHSVVFLYSFLFSTLQINTEYIKTMKEHIWNDVVNKKVLNKPEYVLYFRFFKEATFCFDESFAHSQLSLSQLHEVVTWNGFQLTGVP